MARSQDVVSLQDHASILLYQAKKEFVHTLRLLHCQYPFLCVEIEALLYKYVGDVPLYAAVSKLYRPYKLAGNTAPRSSCNMPIVFSKAADPVSSWAADKHGQENL
ncbi:hypothetical protein Bbelb_096960 [Branchiostoma belcheri]|nr:hypothetical protein Bbelb_096960 [Branchiostoma belcheri]